jgi:hypothetical protein
MQLMAIGEFAARTRLSAKALRLYHDLGLLVPARVDPSPATACAPRTRSSQPVSSDTSAGPTCR